MASISVTKKARGRPKVGSTRVVVRLAPDQMAAVDAWIATQPDSPGRPEAMRRLATLAVSICQDDAPRGGLFG